MRASPSTSAGPRIAPAVNKRPRRCNPLRFVGMKRPGSEASPVLQRANSFDIGAYLGDGTHRHQGQAAGMRQVEDRRCGSHVLDKRFSVSAGPEAKGLGRNAGIHVQNFPKTHVRGLESAPVLGEDEAISPRPLLRKQGIEPVGPGRVCRNQPCINGIQRHVPCAGGCLVQGSQRVSCIIERLRAVITPPRTTPQHRCDRNRRL